MKPLPPRPAGAPPPAAYINQKAAKFGDRRTKRARDRSSIRRQAIERSQDDDT